MRPWLLVTGDFVKTGGMDVANYALARFLADRGDEVHLVAHRVAPELTALPNVLVHLVPKPLGSYLAAGPLLDAAGRLHARRLRPRGARVLVNGGNCAAPGAASWVHYVHAAYAPEVRTHALRRAKERLARAKFLADERRVLSRARFAVVNSDVTRQHVINLLGLPPDRVHTVYYGIETSKFGPILPAERADARARLGLRDDELAIAFIGALGDRRKGFDLLFGALRRCLARDAAERLGQASLSLVVIGAGAELESWKARAQAVGLSDRIRFLGFRSDVPLVLAGCDGLAAPTRYEAYGLGVHEALSRGLPALVSEGAGVAERYPAALHGLRVRPADDEAAWADALQRFVRERASLTEHVRPFAEELRGGTWDGMAERIALLLDA